MTQATKIPWRYDESPLGAITDSDFCVVANTCGRDKFRDNARLIVHCVNTHDELVAALKIIHDCMLYSQYYFEKHGFKNNHMNELGKINQAIKLCNEVLSKTEPR